MLEVADSRRPTASTARSTGSALASRAARSWSSSAPTAPARRTLLKAIAGLVAPRPAPRTRSTGAILAGLPPHAIVEAGLALVPEGRGIFGELTVRENLALGAHARRARASDGARTSISSIACSRGCGSDPARSCAR